MNFSFFFSSEDHIDSTPRPIDLQATQPSDMASPLQTQRKGSKSNPFKWKQAENKKYINFLKSKLHLMDLPIEQRKKIRINVIMSNFIKTRNPEQCRSHHQKMVLKYGSIENIIAAHNPKRTQVKKEQQTIKIEDDVKAKTYEIVSEVTEEPLWYQYLNIFSSHQSQEYNPTEEMLF